MSLGPGKSAEREIKVPHAPELTQLTIRELWVAELQIFACSGRVVLCAHWVFHALNVLFQIVERAKDVFHALAVVHGGCIRLHVAGPFGLLGGLDRQGLDNLPWWTLCMEEKERKKTLFYTAKRQHENCWCEYSQEDQGDQLNQSLLLDQQDPGIKHD